MNNESRFPSNWGTVFLFSLNFSSSSFQATDYTHLWVLEFVVDSEQFTRVANPQPLEGRVDWF